MHSDDLILSSTVGSDTLISSSAMICHPPGLITAISCNDDQ